MVRGECLVGTGNLPKFGDNLYRDAEEDYWFVPTAEVPVTNLYREEILAGDLLPIRHVAYTPCFRREKMSHGKDTRGIKRGHQFDKVEMVQFVHPADGRRALDELTGHALHLLELLGLRHRLVKMCTGDLSFVACMKYDLEAWAPGCNEWLEVSSCSLFGDFQARRAKIRFKDNQGKNRFVHTLNGSGLALPRVMIALVESFQQPDGSVLIPEILRPYLHGQERISPP
jgi:seryl-tRNA synthetase